jgi:AcrR family transcriptional regulator
MAIDVTDRQWSPGRPRDPRADRAILDAARELLADSDVATLSFEAIAARARVGKTTIYRRWRTKEDLLLALFADTAEQTIGVEDLGDTRRELLELLSSLVRASNMTSPVALHAVVAELAHNPRLRASFTSQILDRRRGETDAVIARGVARGDLRDDVDPATAHEMLMGPLCYRLLLSGEPMDAGFAEAIVDAFLRGAAASPRPRRAPRARG